MAKPRRWRRRRATRGRLDLGGERPSASAYREPVEFPDRIQIAARVGPNGFATQMEIEVKGRLHRAAEFLVLCRCAAVVAVIAAVVAHLAGAVPWLVVLTSGGAAVATCLAGRRYLSHPRRPPES